MLNNILKIVRSKLTSTIHIIFIIFLSQNESNPQIWTGLIFLRITAPLLNTILDLRNRGRCVYRYFLPTLQLHTLPIVHSPLPIAACHSEIFSKVFPIPRRLRSVTPRFDKGHILPESSRQSISINNVKRGNCNVLQSSFLVHP